MSDTPPNLLQRGREIARDQVLASVRTRYFPEIWYALENWFQLMKGRRVLEIGCGLGLVSEALAKSGWNVTCVDDSLGALERLRSSFDEQKLVGTFEQAEADKLPFANQSFDAVVSVNALEFSVNPAEAAREVARVLTPGGRAVIATFNKLSPWGLPAVARAMRPNDDGRLARFMTKTDFVSILKATGLNVEDVKDRAGYLPVAGRVKLRLPVAGAFVALVAKGGARGGKDDGKKFAFAK